MTLIPTKTRESIEGTGTTSYGYDHNGDRVFKTTSEGTTYYPFSNYEITDTGTTTKHIYMGDMLVATIEGSGAGALTYYNHLDHLNSTRVVTDGIGYISNSLDFYPFGHTRIDNDYGDFRQHIQHTGNYKDDETSLIYRGARYYDGGTGRFTSMEPYVFGDLKTIINDPQLMNTYGYARNNPLIYHDPNGELPVLIPFAVGVFVSAYYGSNEVQSTVNSGVNQTLAAASGHTSMSQYNQSVAQMSNDNVGWKFAIDNPKVTGGIVAAGSAPAMYGGVAALTMGKASLAKGIGVSSALKRLVGAGALGYLAVDQVADGVPSAVTAIGDIEANGLSASNVGSLSWEIGMSYAPGALGLLGRNGEYAGSVLEITDLSRSIAEKVDDEDN